MTRPILLTGGGTGGHVFPLRAIAEALVARGVPRSELVIVGSSRGQDPELLADLGVELVLLPGRGLRRRLSIEAVWDNAGALGGLARATAAGVALVRRRQPRAVVSVGGYAAFAACAGAIVWHRPLVLVDLDATPGLVHRVVAPFSAAIATALPRSTPRAVVTGAPVREELTGAHRDEAGRAGARARLGLPARGPVVAVVTGSLGAGSVNEAVCDLAAAWSTSPPATLYHVTGRRDEAWVQDRRDALGAPGFWHVVGFESDMPALYAACDVAVCRAGATTVAELCATATPAVLVPLPSAPGAHQHANAKVLEAAGAAVVVDDGSLASGLAPALMALLGDAPRLQAMSVAAASLAHPDAAARVADLVVAHAR